MTLPATDRCRCCFFLPVSPLERACDVSFVGVTRRGRIIERWRQQRANGRVKRWYLRQVTCLRRIVRGEQALKYGWLLSLWQVRGAINTHVHKNTLLIWICFPPKVPATVHYARSKAINKTNRRALHFRWHTIGWSLKGKHKGYRGSFGHLSCLLDLRGLIRQTSAEEHQHLIKTRLAIINQLNYWHLNFTPHVLLKAMRRCFHY